MRRAKAGPGVLPASLSYIAVYLKTTILVSAKSWASPEPSQTQQLLIHGNVLMKPETLGLIRQTLPVALADSIR